jgi:hypothetical protein
MAKRRSGGGMLDKLDKKFLGHDTVFGVGPWGKADLH